MPLSKGKSKRSLKKNVNTLIDEGKRPGQAYAIAKSIQKSAIKKSTLTEFNLTSDDLIKIITEVLADELAKRGLLLEGDKSKTDE